MYYKVSEGSETHIKLHKLLARLKAIKQAKLEMAKEITGSDDPKLMVSGSNFDLTATVFGLAFDKKPEGWLNKTVVDGTDVYRPDNRTKIGKEISKRFNSFENIPVFKLNAIISSVPVSKQGFYFPGIKQQKGVFLIAVLEEAFNEGFKPHPDLIEITHSEYNA